MGERYYHTSHCRIIAGINACYAQVVHCPCSSNPCTTGGRWLYRLCFAGKEHLSPMYQTEREATAAAARAVTRDLRGTVLPSIFSEKF